MDIVGKPMIDYFNINCAKCGVQTENEYWPGEDVIPHFRATCPKCGGSNSYKFSQSAWKNLPTMKSN